MYVTFWMFVTVFEVFDKLKYGLDKWPRQYIYIYSFYIYDDFE